MKIERKFYQKQQEEIRQMEKELQEEWEQLSLREQEEERERQTIECQQIINGAEYRERHTIKMPVEKKVQLFKKLAQDAVRFAEDLGLDVLVESDEETSGRIILKGQMYIICSSGFRSTDIQQTFINMITEATDFWINTEDGLIKMDLMFQLSSPIYIKM